MSEQQEQKKRPTRRELIEAERKKAGENNVVPVENFYVPSDKKSKFFKSVLLVLQILVIIVIPITGALNTPLSSLGASEDYESMLEKIENETLDSNSNLNKVISSNSRYKVRAGAADQCSVEGSANGDKLVNKNFTLQWPMIQGTYTQTSPFGYRSDPATGRHVLHSGVDMAAPVGTSITSVADGVVKTVDVYGGANRIILLHEINGVPTETWYLHMYSNGVYVKEGQEVKMGDIIAGVGSSGYSTGPHLHFEVHPHGEDAVDPVRWLKENKAVLLQKEC